MESSHGREKKNTKNSEGRQMDILYSRRSDRTTAISRRHNAATHGMRGSNDGAAAEDAWRRNCVTQHRRRISPLPRQCCAARWRDEIYGDIVISNLRGSSPLARAANTLWWLLASRSGYIFSARAALAKRIA
jgi:hypothetical protein